MPLYNVRLQNSISTLTSSNLPTLFRRLTSVNAQSSIYFQCLLLPVNVEGPFHSRHLEIICSFSIIMEEKKCEKINVFQIQKYFRLQEVKDSHYFLSKKKKKIDHEKSIKIMKNKLNITFHLRNFRNFFLFGIYKSRNYKFKSYACKFTGSRCCDVNVYKKFSLVLIQRCTSINMNNF